MGGNHKDQDTKIHWEIVAFVRPLVALVVKYSAEIFN